MLAVLAIIIGGAAVLSHTAPAPFLFEAFRPARSIWRIQAQPGSPTLYVTFDDGPNPAWTPAVLDALKDSGIRATFFLIDAHITPETAPIVKRISDEGHAIGLHSGTRRMMILSPDAFAQSIQAAAGRIQAITGKEPCRLFRPHAGWRSASMYQGLEQIDYRLAGWSWGMWDWDWWRRRSRVHAPGAKSVSGRHHRDSRRPSQESARRSEICRRDGPPSGPPHASAGLFVLASLLNGTTPNSQLPTPNKNASNALLCKLALEVGGSR
jgi:peptidoglycan/xylan/chitin deacetylase (PgdA/CDA1 family)